jgi:hypothetical protein
MARSVPSGMSPGWLGTVVYRFEFGLNQISWLPAAWRSKEAAGLQLSDDVSVSESSETPHLGGYNDREIAPLACCRQSRYILAFAPRLDELSRDVTRDVERLGYGAALRDKTG